MSLICRVRSLRYWKAFVHLGHGNGGKCCLRWRLSSYRLEKILEHSMHRKPLDDASTAEEPRIWVAGPACCSRSMLFSVWFSISSTSSVGHDASRCTPPSCPAGSVLGVDWIPQCHCCKGPSASPAWTHVGTMNCRKEVVDNSGPDVPRGG